MKIKKLILDTDEIMAEVRRGYQQRVATLCIDAPEEGIEEVVEARGYVVEEASRNWSNPGIIQLVEISDTTGSGGYLASILGKFAIEGIPYYEKDVVQFQDSENGKDAQRDYRVLLENDAVKGDWEIFVEDYEDTFIFFEDVIPMIQKCIMKDLNSLENIEIEKIEWT
jgi:hypothetical protein